jgi:hypothetical protein
MTTYSEQALKDIAGALTRIANALEEQNKPKSLTIPRNWGHGIADCVSKEEVPLSTPWNSDNKPSCNSDILYKKPENPNWYNIKENNK